MNKKSTQAVCKKLLLSDIENDMLLQFDRCQPVKRHYAKTEGGTVIEDCCYTDDWDEGKKRRRAEEFRDIICGGGTVIAAYDGERVVGFGCVGSSRLGSADQYLQLMYLHVSREHRGAGIGSVILNMCASAARAAGAEKLYISANSAYETQQFYRSRGCVEASEIIQRLSDKEPYDIQMELNLGAAGGTLTEGKA